MSNKNLAAVEPGPAAFNSMWSWFMGVPWAPKFNGETGGLENGDWSDESPS